MVVCSSDIKNHFDIFVVELREFDRNSQAQGKLGEFEWSRMFPPFNFGIYVYGEDWMAVRGVGGGHQVFARLRKQSISCSFAKKTILVKSTSKDKRVVVCSSDIKDHFYIFVVYPFKFE